MLKLDRAARLKTPRLFREGMVIGKKDLLTPGWGISDAESNSCGSQSYLSVHRSPRGKCRGKGKDVPESGWLCFCGNEAREKTGGRTERPSRISVLCASRSGRRSPCGGRWVLRRWQGESHRRSVGRRHVVRSRSSRLRRVFDPHQRRALQELDSGNDVWQNPAQHVQSEGAATTYTRTRSLRRMRGRSCADCRVTSLSWSLAYPPARILGNFRLPTSHTRASLVVDVREADKAEKVKKARSDTVYPLGESFDIATRDSLLSITAHTVGRIVQRTQTTVPCRL